MAKRSKTVRRGRGQRGGIGFVGAEGGEVTNPHVLDGGTRRYGRTKRRGSRRGRGQRGGDEYDLKAKQFLAGLPTTEKPAFAQQYAVLKRELGSSEVAFNKMMSRRSAPTNIQIAYEDDAKVQQFIRRLPTTEKPAFASKYTELKKTMGSEAAFNKMMSQRMQSNSANDTNLMEHYGVSLDDKPPVSANVPYSSNDSSLSSLYQHYGLT